MSIIISQIPSLCHQIACCVQPIHRNYRVCHLTIMCNICVFIQVLKISLIGHRKRILASLGDRLHEDTPQKPPRAISLRVSESQWEDSMCCMNKYNSQHCGFKLLWLHQTEKESTSPFPRWPCVSLREQQPPHGCRYHPTDYPNLSGRHKMADPLQFPPCRLVLDTNHIELAFPLPSVLHSNVLIIVSCSCQGRGPLLPGQHWKSRPVDSAPFCTITV